MDNPVEQHRSDSPTQIRCAAITVSDTRTEATDTGGQLLTQRLTDAGHLVVRRAIIPDEPEPMSELLRELCDRADVDVVLLTGGTGLSARDQTCETVSAIFSKKIPGYGELFRRLSYEHIGPAAMLSRAVGGLVGSTVILTMPGSPKAVALAMDQIILPELGHLVRETRR